MRRAFKHTGCDTDRCGCHKSDFYCNDHCGCGKECANQRKSAARHKHRSAAAATFDERLIHDALLKLVRNPKPLRPERAECAYTLRPFNDHHHSEIEHIFECQAAAHLLEVSEDKYVNQIRQQLGPGSLSSQPIVVRQFMEPIYNIHNDDFNLTLALHSPNMKKKQAFSEVLARRPDFPGLMTRLVELYQNDPDTEHDASQSAKNTCKLVKTASSEYQGQLQDVGGSKAAVYESIADDLAELLERMEI